MEVRCRGVLEGRARWRLTLWCGFESGGFVEEEERRDSRSEEEVR